MGVDIPQPFKSTIQGAIGPVTVDGIPDHFDIKVTDVPTIKLDIEKIPDVHLSIDKIPKITLGVDPVEIRLTELPSIRGHLPADFCIGLSILGMELMNVRLCGEAQIITEPYKPNPCEVCGPVIRPNPNPPDVVPVTPVLPNDPAVGLRPQSGRKG